VWVLHTGDDHRRYGSAAFEPRPNARQIIAAMDHHLCRCATYPNILVAIESLAGSFDEEDL